MTEYGEVIFLLYMALVGSWLAIWTFRTPKGDVDR